MEQGSRLDSTPVSARQDTTGNDIRDAARDAAITRMLTEPSLTARTDAASAEPTKVEEIREVMAGARMAAPSGRAPLDAALLNDFDGLNRIEAAIEAMLAVEPIDRELDDIPGFGALEEARDKAIDRIAKGQAEGLIGLQVKANAMLSPYVSESICELSHQLGLSLARDVVGLGQRAIGPRSDAILAVIEESQRLDRLHDALLVALNGEPASDPRRPEERAAQDALWRHWRETTLSTVPQTADGCRALAAHAADWFKRQGSNDEDAETILGLIARSPLHEPAATVDTTAEHVLRPKALPARDASSEQPDCAALMARLLALYAEDRASRPIAWREPNSVAGRAALLVQCRVWALAREILLLPPPQSRDGLALVALASAIIMEGDCRDLNNFADCAIAGVTRAALAFTGTAEPPGFSGFGDEADHLARERALDVGEGSVPAWAVAEIEVECETSHLGTAAPGQTEVSKLVADVSAPGGAPAIQATPDDGVPTSVEARLLSLASAYRGFTLAVDEANAFEDRIGQPLPHNDRCAHEKALHYGLAGREDAVRHAMALPATTLRAFGLQAQILEHDAITIWDEDGNDRDLMRCRALLQGLIAAAGLSPIEHRLTTADEIRGWLADPATAPGAEPARAGAQ